VGGLVGRFVEVGIVGGFAAIRIVGAFGCGCVVVVWTASTFNIEHVVLF
jgi:hypothetical protein